MKKQKEKINIIEIEMPYSCAKKRKVKELIISNMKLPTVAEAKAIGYKIKKFQ